MPKSFALHPQLAADTSRIGELPLCRALLMHDSQFPWVILVPRQIGIEEIYQLNSQDQLQLNQESIATGQLMMNHFAGDKLNIGALGNVVPQLHVHHIVRFKNDAAWPKPVWGNVAPRAYSESTLQTRIADLSALFAEQFNDFTAC